MTAGTDLADIGLRLARTYSIQHAGYRSVEISCMCEYFKWDASQYSVSVAEMDREHETLIVLMNVVQEILQSQAAWSFPVGNPRNIRLK
jgi:hypothetical protein